MKVSVYTKSSSKASRATHKQLSESGVEFSVYDLGEYPDALKNITRDGFHQAPVVSTPLGNWCGHIVSKINALVLMLQGEGESEESRLAYEKAKKMLREE